MLTLPLFASLLPKIHRVDQIGIPSLLTQERVDTYVELCFKRVICVRCHFAWWRVFDDE